MISGRGRWKVSPVGRWQQSLSSLIPHSWGHSVTELIHNLPSPHLRFEVSVFRLGLHLTSRLSFWPVSTRRALGPRDCCSESGWISISQFFSRAPSSPFVILAACCLRSVPPALPVLSACALDRAVRKSEGLVGTCLGDHMASPRTVTIVALSVALGLFFVFMGTIKLTPRLSKDAYSEMVSEAYGWWGAHSHGIARTSPLFSFSVSGTTPLAPIPTWTLPSQQLCSSEGRSSWARAISFVGYAVLEPLNASWGRGCPANTPHPK